jgi:O-antigen/teichoic acid export membrane protein
MPGPLSTEINSLRAAVVRGAGGTFFVTVAGTALGLLLQIILARTLGVQEFGVYAYATTWLAILAVASMAGMDTSALRFVSAYLAKGDLNTIHGFVRYGRSRVVLFSVCIAIAMAVLSIAFADRLGGVAVFLIASVLLPINVLIIFHGAALQGLNRAVQSQAIQLVFRAVLMLTLLGLLHASRGVDAESAMTLNLLSAVMTLAFVVAILWRHRSPAISLNLTSEQVLEWRSASLLLFSVAVCQAILSQVDILLVGFLMDTADVGLYAVASRIATLVTFGITTVNAYLAPQIAYLYAKGERMALQDMVTMVARGVFLYTIAAALILLLCGRWILALFGAEFVQIYDVLQVLIVGQLLIGMCGPVGFLLTMTGHQRDALYAIGSSAVLAVVLNLALIPGLGLYGAAIATVIAIAFRSAALGALVLRKLSINPTAFAIRTLR